MTVNLLELPDGARIPMGNPAPWLAAAAAADWQCECITSGKSACGRSHRDDEGRRCPRKAAGPVAVRLILAPAVDGALRLLCETCAGGHARAAARARQAAEPAESDDQATLF
jgi:hypothetical protein